MGNDKQFFLAPRLRQALLAASVALAAGLLAGCPPMPGPDKPLVATQPASTEPAPVLGAQPPSDGIFPPLFAKGAHDPLTADALAKGLTPLAQIDVEVNKSATTPTTTTTAPATEEHDPPPMAMKYYLQAREKFLEGANADAAELLDRALRLDPNNFPALRLMGRVCFASAQLARGSLYLQRAANLQPNDVDVNYLLGRYWIERKEFPTAIRFFLVASHSPERTNASVITPLTSFYLGRALQAAGYHLAAARQYQNFLIIAAQPIPGYRYDREMNTLLDEPWAVHLAAAENFAAVGRFADALPEYQFALETSVNPADPYINSRLVAAQTVLGQYAPAIRRAAELVKSTQGSDNAVALLTWVYKQSGRESQMLADLQAQIAQSGGGAQEADNNSDGFLLALANLQERAGHKDEALKTLDRYLAWHVEDLGVLRRLVTLARDNHDWATAFHGLSATLAAHPEKLSEIRDLLALLVGDKPTKESFLALETAAGHLTAEPKSTQVSSDLLLAIVAQATDEPAKAARYFESCIAGNPNSWPARETYLTFLLAREEFAKADVFIQKAIDTHQGGAKAYELLLESEVAQQRYAHALDLALKAKDNFPDSPEIRLALATVYELRGQGSQADTELRQIVDRFPKNETAYRRLIDIDLNKGNSEGAVALLGRLMQQVPQSRFGKLFNARLYGEAGRAGEAEQIIRQLMGDGVPDSDCLAIYVWLKAQTRQFDEGIDYLRALLTKHEATPVLIANLADLYRAQQRPEEALRIIEKYAKQHPGSEPWAILYAQELISMERKNDAEAVLREGLDKNPTSQSLAVTYARFLGQNDRAADGEDLVQKFIARNGPNAARLYLLSSLQQEDGHETQSLETLQQLLKLMPDHTGANNDLGYFWTDRGQHLDQAEVMIRRALLNEPNNGAFLDSLGWVLYKRGQFAQAVEPLEKAVATPEGKMPEVLGHLGSTLYRLNRKDDAVKRWDEAQNMFRDDIPLSPSDKKIKDFLKGVLQQVHDGKEASVPPVGEKQAVTSTTAPRSETRPSETRSEPRP